MDNPILYTDLFEKTGIDKGIEDLIKQIQSIGVEMDKMLSNVKESAKGISIGGDGKSISATASEVEQLAKANEEATRQNKALQKQLEALQRIKAEKDIERLRGAYSSLGDIIEKTGVNVGELGLNQKQFTQALKNAEVAANSAKGSYNELYAQYNLLKIALNAMGEEMRNDTKIGGEWEKQADAIMSRLKAMQANTGNFTLDVGNYSKALNGLNISTQQVLREMPTLANSLSQFIIAISNNVPIFLDNFKKVREETGSFAIAMKGVITSIFSWQTALLVVLTVLPGFIRKVNEKRKAQEADNGATKDAITLAKLYRDSLLNEKKAISDSISGLEALLSIMTDNNRSREEQVAALQAAKREYPELIAFINEEGSSYGNNEEAIRAYIERLKVAAQAQAKFNEIVSLSSKKLEKESELSTLEESNPQVAFRVGLLRETKKELEKTLFEQRRAYDNANAVNKAEIANLISQTEDRVKALDKEITKLSEPFQKVRDEIAALETQIENNTDDLTKAMLDSLGKTEKGSRDTNERLKEDADYYFEYQESRLNTLEDGMEKEIKLEQLRNAKLVKEWKDRAKKDEENGVATEESRREIEAIIANAYEESRKRILAIMKKYNDKEKKERYDSGVKELDDELTIAKNLAVVENANAVRRQKAIASAEATYWLRRIALAKELGGEYLDEIEVFEAKLAKAQEIMATGASNTGQPANKRTGNFLYTILFGEAEKENKPSEQLANFVSNIKSAFSTAFSYMDEMIDKRIEMAEVAIEMAQRESEAAKSALDAELEARANGYANNVEYARREYEERLAIEEKATKEKERLEKVQEAVDSAQQVSSLVTATANLLSGYSSIPLVGQALAIAAIATMWSTFAAAKITASSITKYGDGMSEYLDYGGSHASGHDIDFGRDKHGRLRRVERGEMIGVINKRNVDKYGVDTISGIISSLNDGTFEQTYTMGKENLADKYGLAFSSPADLSGVESGLRTIIEQGNKRMYQVGNKTIEIKGNTKRIIYN